MIELKSKGWAVFGLRGSGKSWFVKHVLDSSPDHLIYDPLKEHRGYNKYTPTDRTSIDELSKVIEGPVIRGVRVTEENKRQFPTRRVGETWKPDLFVIDEANRYIYPHPREIPKAVADLVDYGRHWNLSFGVVARRPVQFHTTLIELADVVFFFYLPGQNDYQKLEGMHPGLGDAVRSLPAHHFVALSHGTEITIHAPIEPPRHPDET
jgi:hypothetical protein